MVQKLTKKQTQILEFILNYMEDNDKSPSYREIASGLGLSSVASVAEHVDNIIEKGFLKKVPGMARSLEYVDNSFSETTELFKNKLIIASPEETKILLKAAQILGIQID